MLEWFDDDEVQELLTKLLDRLCTLERMGGEVYSSQLVFIPANTRFPILMAAEGKPCPQDSLSDLDVEMVVKTALMARRRKKE